MPLDLAALKAKLNAKAAQLAAEGIPNEEVNTDSKTTNNSNSNSNNALVASNSTTVASTAELPPISNCFSLSTAERSADESVPFNHMEFMTKMQELQQAIHTRHPQMPLLLKTIHTQLKKDPELVTILSEDGIGLIVSGLKLQTGTEITTKKVAATKAGKKVVIGADEL